LGWRYLFKQAHMEAFRCGVSFGSSKQSSVFYSNVRRVPSTHTIPQAIQPITPANSGMGLILSICHDNGHANRAQNEMSRATGHLAGKKGLAFVICLPTKCR
jgi:hypothetical protein